MADRSVTVQLPEDIYEQLRLQAERAHVSVEERFAQIAAEAAEKAGDLSEKLPEDLRHELAQLRHLSDEALWHAARTRVSRKSSARSESLHLKQQREGLTEAEQQEASSLVRQFDRVILIRAEAAALLHQRGHDVSVLLSPP